MEKLRITYPLVLALLAAIVAVLCFSLIPSWDPSLGFVDYGTFRQTLTAAVIMAGIYIFTGEWQLDTLDVSGREEASSVHSPVASEAANPGHFVNPGHSVTARLPLPATKPFLLVRTSIVLGVAALATGLAAVYVQGVVLTPPRSAILMFLAVLAGTAVFEEILFRAFFFEAFAKVLYSRNVKQSLLKAAIASSLLFGILHVSSDLGSLFRVSAFIQAGVKIAEGLLFGLVMCAFYIKTRSVWPAVLAHFVFNILSELPIYLATGVQKFSYITGSPADIAVLLIACIILLPAAKRSYCYIDIT